MSRREALVTLLAAGMPATARGAVKLLGGASGAALLLDVRTRRLVGVEGSDLARRALIPPGSTLKPFSLQALLEAGKLDPRAQFPCPGKLAIAGRSFNCSHPPLDSPADIAGAIAYSCNCFVAHFAERFGPGELAERLLSFGLASPTGLLGDSETAGRVLPAATPDAKRLQAIGEDRVLVTPLGLLMAYRRLASLAARPEMAPIIDGLEGAVEYGTAQMAQVPGLRVAGKTGSVMTAAGAHAWFAGFAPSRSPEVVVTVVVQGRSGAGDAAPIGGRLVAAHKAGRL
ncbi:MAG TPA: penicillin-binding transpeptidase domain-containing protein [Bryobacteraceae bacterium]|nr:penicillin-binding transpeptidase domain-containing protein [Bryobacteraceae bacterium]